MLADDLDEPTRLAHLRARARELGADPTGGAFDLFFRGESAAALAAFERAKGSFWGHDLFQSTRPFAARAIATARAGREDLAIARFREMGHWFEGGSVAGHALALLVLLGRYDKLEEHPPFPEDARGLTADLRRRIEARNALLRPAAQVEARVRLAWLAGEEVDADLYTQDEIDPALAGEVALRAGDLKHADLRFRTLASWREDWLTKLRGQSDPRAQGLFGRARVARKRKKLTLALERCDECLALDPKHAGALLLAMALSARRTPKRAAAYRARLDAAHPLDDIVVDDLSRDRVQRELGGVGPRRAAYVGALAAMSALRYREAASLFSRALDGARGPLRGAERGAAASLLYALAAESDDELRARAGALLESDPGFVSAREALAFATGRAGDRGEAERLYRGAGTARLFDAEIALDDWLALPVARALSPLPASAEDRAASLLMRGATDAGLCVLDEVSLAPDAEIRWLAAGCLWKDHALSTEEEKRSAAERAWALLEPLVRSEVAAPIAELAIEIAAATGRRVTLSVPRPRSPEDRRALELAVEAWALERRGEIDVAIATYLRAAEAHPPLCALGLGNAGNLLTLRGAHDRALDFLTTALTHVSTFPPTSRALVLSQVAHHFRCRAMHADALPCESLAFELAPTAARAARVALDHRALGDDARARHFRAITASLEPRQPELHEG